jgi:pimeloyl-ACP methyl ester carboxylesterase
MAQTYYAPMWNALALGAVLWFSSGCTHLIYAPSRVKYVDDRKLTHPPEEVRFTSNDGVRLVGWYFGDLKRPPKGVFVFFHGNGQNLSSHFVLLYWIVEHGYDFFIFDYPGYGISEGEPSPKGTVDAGLAAMTWARKRNPGAPIMVYGQSLGGAVALRTLLELNGEIPVCLMVLDSTFQSYRAAARDLLASSAVTWLFQPLTYVLINDTWSAQGKVSELKIPAVVMHSEGDKIVRYQRGRELYNALSDPKVLWTVKDPGHTEGLVGNERVRWRQQLLGQLDQYCSLESH